MIRIRTHVEILDKLLVAAIFEAAEQRLARAGELVRSEVADSIKIAPVGVPSPKGTPPHTHEGKRVDYKLKKAIASAHDPETRTVVVGPAGVGAIGRVHEFGTRRYPRRAFMVPGMLGCLSAIPRFFSQLALASTRAGRALRAKRR